MDKRFSTNCRVSRHVAWSGHTSREHKRFEDRQSVAALDLTERNQLLAVNAYNQYI